MPDTVEVLKYSAFVGCYALTEVYVSAGAGFIVAITGTIMTMPGLPKTPAANQIDVNESGVITGLF